MITVASHQALGFIPCAMPHAFPLTNHCHSLLSCTTLLPCLTSKPHFLKQSFKESIHLFRTLPTERLSAYSSQSYHSPSSQHGQAIRVHTIINPFIYPLHHSAQLPYPCIQDSILLLIPSKHLRLSICTVLILDLSFSFQNFVPLPHIRTTKVSCKTI